jgi:two-component system chemotaxis response regulator CheY
MTSALPAPRRILIVDDDASVRSGLTTLLEAVGHEVFTAADGEEALTVLRRDRADLVVLDLNMPVMDGLTFRLQQLLDPDLADIPVIVLSAAEGDLARELRTLGIRSYLTKPRNGDETIQVMGRLVDAVDGLAEAG